MTLCGHGWSDFCADPVCRMLCMALLLLHPGCCWDNFLPIKMQFRLESDSVGMAYQCSIAICSNHPYQRPENAPTEANKTFTIDFKGSREQFSCCHQTKQVRLQLVLPQLTWLWNPDNLNVFLLHGMFKNRQDKVAGKTDCWEYSLPGRRNGLAEASRAFPSPMCTSLRFLSAN